MCQKKTSLLFFQLQHNTSIYLFSNEIGTRLLDDLKVVLNSKFWVVSFEP